MGATCHSAGRSDGRTAAYLAAAMTCAVLTLLAAWLRETPMFWRNAGGYPILLRDAVRVGFLPLLAAHIGLSAWVWWRVVERVVSGRPPRGAILSVACLLAILTAVSALVILVN